MNFVEHLLNHPGEPLARPVYVAFYSMKGGSGKSTTAGNFAAMCASMGIRTLLCLADKQETTERNFIPGYIDNGKNLFSVLAGRCGAKDAIRESLPLKRYAYTVAAVGGSNRLKPVLRRAYTGKYFNLPVMPSGADINAFSLGLGGVDYEAVFHELDAVRALAENGGDSRLISEKIDAVKNTIANPGGLDLDKLRIFSRRMSELDGMFDLVVVDCTPTENDTVMAILAGVDYVVLPIDGVEALKSFELVTSSIRELNAVGFPVKLAGVVMTKYKRTQGVSKAVLEILRGTCGNLFIEPPIIESAAIRNAYANQTFLCSAPISDAELNFREFTLATLRRIEVQ